MLVVVADNLGYQSTGGQFGPTTPSGARTDSSPYGAFETSWLGPDLDVLDILKSAGATFLARHLSLDGAGSVESLVRGLENPGFSLVHVIYPCVTHFGAVTLGERDPVKVMGWFKELFAKGEAPYRSGVWHDAAGSRPEFGEGLRRWTRAVAGGSAPAPPWPG
jgi:2-oxoglutarate ferredoxin oxidoreductase subunit beta